MKRKHSLFVWLTSGPSGALEIRLDDVRNRLERRGWDIMVALVRAGDEIELDRSIT